MRTSIALILSVLLLVPALGRPALAGPGPEDLIVVFNRQEPVSREVAVYYASKRRVPADNLVEVAVPRGEDMSRADFEQHLVPPVKAKVEELQAAGKRPAILLVFGIPLRVGPAASTPGDQGIKKLATAKVEARKKQVLQLVDELNRSMPSLPGKPLWKKQAPRQSPPTSQVLVQAHQACLRGEAYLKKLEARGGKSAARDRVMDLLIQLGGTSPEARALMAKAARGQGRERRELLGFRPGLKIEAQEDMFRGIPPNNAAGTAAAIRETRGLMGELHFWDYVLDLYSKRPTNAAVDSELTLIMAGPYQSRGWLPNPFNLRYMRLPIIGQVQARTLMVGRLDGPTPAIARRLVDDALAVEKTGLTGVFYVDARGLTGPGNPGSYAWFDRHLLHLAEIVKKSSPLKLVLDKNPMVLRPGSAPDAALYCGWYSLKKYVPAFTWKRGAVGYHVASFEASTLKQPGSQVWCKRMLEEGVAATLGPVAEPYLASFPLPDQFFPLLMTGKLTLLEVYFLTVPQVSWMQILIGDPLYRPFRHDPAIRPRSLQLKSTGAEPRRRP